MLDILKLKKRYLKFAEEDGIEEQEIENVEHILGLTLPNDFKEISRFFCGGCLGIVENYRFTQGKWNNIIDETKRLREEVNLPLKFVVLAEPSESLIVMDVEDKPSIIWCDSIDVYNLGTKSYARSPDTWENYSDFFSELLSDEESDEI